MTVPLTIMADAHDVLVTRVKGKNHPFARVRSLLFVPHIHVQLLADYRLYSVCVCVCMCVSSVRVAFNACAGLCTRISVCVTAHECTRSGCGVVAVQKRRNKTARGRSRLN